MTICAPVAAFNEGESIATVVNGVRHDPNDVPRPVEAAERACYDLVIRERAFTKGSFSQVRRRIEGADAPGRPGAMPENTGSI